MHNNSINQGVKCAVKACKYNEAGHLCNLQQIMVSSDFNDKHYCKSFEENSSSQEF